MSDFNTQYSNLDAEGQAYLQAIHEDRIRNYGEGYVVLSDGTVVSRTDASNLAEMQQNGYFGTSPEGLGPGAEWEQDFIDRYPNLQFLMDIPELHELMRQSVEGGWGPQEFQARLAGTDWFRNRNANMRDWEILQAYDPAEATRRHERQTMEIVNMARAAGIRVSWEQANQLATDALIYGLSNLEIKANLFKMVQAGVIDGTNAFADSQLAVRQLADAYMLRLSDGQVQDYAGRIFQGDLTLDVIRADFISKSAAAYPWMAEELKAGLTPSEYYAPLVSDVANLLEVTPDSINLMDSQWSAIVSVNDNGTRRAPTRTEVEQWARAKPEWLETQNGAEASARTGGQILETFGAIKT